MSPKITIIMPVHNSGRYIKECIDSIIAQDYGNFELCIIDDNSSDESVEICKEYQLKDSRIKILASNREGVSAARNTGIMHSSGEWITFVDSDDIITSNYCSSLLNYVDDSTDLVIGRTISFKDDIAKQYDDGFRANIVNAFSTHSQKKKLLKSIFNDNYKDIKYPHISTCSAKLFRKNKIQNKYDESIKVYEDAIFNIQYIFDSKKVKLVNEKIYYYRLNNSSTTRASDEKIIERYINATKKIKEICQKNSINYKEYEYYFAIKNLNTILESHYRFHKGSCFCKECINNKFFKDAIRKVKISALPKKRKVAVILMRLKAYKLIEFIYRKTTK